ncbi:MAG: glycosyltransferase family 9 protein [Oligoflexia bacterium]|nr:glycosyltransferase family 9 protein [Oligoflexia bacterium]
MGALKPNASILIVLMGSLGDVARGLHLARSIKTQLPESKITWLVEPASAELVKVHPSIDRIIVFERRLSWGALRAVISELRRDKFDLVLDLQRHFKSGCFSLLSGAPQRLGFNRRDAKEFNWVFNNQHIPAYGDALSKLEHYLKFAHHLGLSEQDFGSGLEQLDLAERLKKLSIEPGSPYLFIVLGSAWESKDWLPSGYTALLDRLCASLRYPLFLVGGPGHRNLGAELQQRSGSDLVRSIAGETSLLDLIALIRYARAGVGPDSGPGHLASALRVPYVSLFGATSPARTAPWGQANLVVRSSIGCSPCGFRKCPGLNRLCMRLISAESVMLKIAEALDQGPIGHSQGQL